jgi:hypothetical protein
MELKDLVGSVTTGTPIKIIIETTPNNLYISRILSEFKVDNISIDFGQLCIKISDINKNI